jgi:hypothetical protein
VPPLQALAVMALLAAASGAAAVAAPVFVFAVAAATALILALAAPVGVSACVVVVLAVGGRPLVVGAPTLGGLTVAELAPLVLVPALITRTPGLLSRDSFTARWGVLICACLIPFVVRNDAASSDSATLRNLVVLWYPVYAFIGMQALKLGGRPLGLLVAVVPIATLVAQTLLNDPVFTTTEARRVVPGWAGGIGAMAFAVGLVGAVTHRRPVVAAVAVVPALVLVAASSHGSAWIAAAGGGLVALVLLRRVRRPGPGLVITCVLVAFGLAAAAGFGIVPDGATAILERPLVVLRGTDDPNIDDRLTRWRASVEAVARGGLIGEGFSREFPAPEGRPSGAPHNIAVTMLFRGGLLGLGLFLWLLLSPLAPGRPAEATVYAAAGGAVAAGVIMSMFNVLLESPYFAPVLWSMVGVALAARRPAGRETQPAKDRAFSPALVAVPMRLRETHPGADGRPGRPLPRPRVLPRGTVSETDPVIGAGITRLAMPLSSGPTPRGLGFPRDASPVGAPVQAGHADDDW